MDQIIEFECVDLTGVKAREPDPHMFQQRPQLLLVILSDQSLGRLPRGLLTGTRIVRDRRGHGDNVSIRLFLERRAVRDSEPCATPRPPRYSPYASRRCFANLSVPGSTERHFGATTRLRYQGQMSCATPARIMSTPAATEQRYIHTVERRALTARSDRPLASKSSACRLL